MSMMRELYFLLRLQIYRKTNEILICQAKYIKELLKKFDIEDSSLANTPISTATKLDLDPKGKRVDSKINREMVGSLLYLISDLMLCMSHVFVQGFKLTEKSHT